MKSFYEFCRLLENNQIASAGDMPAEKAVGAGQMPPVSGEPQPQMQQDEPEQIQPKIPTAPGGPEEAKTLEDVGNAIRKVLEEKLFPALDKKQISKEVAMELYNTIASEISNRYGITASKTNQGMNNAMATNSEPRSPSPKQPTAQG